MLTGAAQKGVSLIELMIGLVILGMLLMAGLPSFTIWLQNTRIRNAAEVALSGLQLARAEAARRNASTAFVFTNAPPVAASAPAVSVTGAAVNTGRNWMLLVYPGGGPPPPPYTAADFIQGAPMAVDFAPVTVQRTDSAGSPFSSGGSSAQVDTLIFNSLGQASSVLNGTTTVTDYFQISADFANPAGGACQHESPPGPMRCLRVVVSRGGNVRMCDPSVTVATDPRVC